MRQLPYPHEFREQSGTSEAYLVLHGVGAGYRSPFMQSLVDELSARPAAILAYDFPYLKRAENPSVGLREEQTSVGAALDFLSAQGYEQVTVVAKSLGGIVLSRWLEAHKTHQKLSAAIMGYVIGDVSTAALDGVLKLVIQGQHDRYGGPEAVKRELSAYNVQAAVIGIDGNHSYRNEAGEPAYQQQAIELLGTQLDTMAAL